MESINDKIYNQIMSIRDSGITNMLDVRNVLEIAEFCDFEELVNLLESNKGAYVKFIFSGDKAVLHY